MNDQPCKYIGCTNTAQYQNRSCCKCQTKYAGVHTKPPSHPRVNKWRKIDGRYKNIERKLPPNPEPQEEVKDFIQIFREKEMAKAIKIARTKMPKQQYFNENLNYTPKDDGFKTYKRETEQQLDTVGKIKLPWERSR